MQYVTNLEHSSCLLYNQGRGESQKSQHWADDQSPNIRALNKVFFKAFVIQNIFLLVRTELCVGDCLGWAQSFSNLANDHTAKKILQKNKKMSLIFY